MLISILEDIEECGQLMHVIAALKGDGKYTDLVELESLDRYSRKLKNVIILHLESVTAAGLKTSCKKILNKNGRTIETYPKYYEIWKLIGAPGVSTPYLIEILADAGHPNTDESGNYKPQ